MSKIPVMEIFGPTIQGEGMVIGQKTMFIRTAGCDYSCAWCDSSFTWDGTGKDLIKQMEAEEIWQELEKIGSDRFSFVTISGGNPALLKNIDKLINLLKKNGIKIAIETQGSKWQDWFWDVDELTLSPKPPSSKMETNFDIFDMIMDRLNEKDAKRSIKIVIFNDEDYEYAKRFYKRYPEVPFFLQVGNEDLVTMDNEKLVNRLLERYEWLVNKVIEDNTMNNVKVLPQLHTYLWGNKRGV